MRFLEVLSPTSYCNLVLSSSQSVQHTSEVASFSSEVVSFMLQSVNWLCMVC